MCAICGAELLRVVDYVWTCPPDGTTNQEAKKASNPLRLLAFLVVGATGFEPATSCSRSKRATMLRYAPIWRLVCTQWVGIPLSYKGLMMTQRDRVYT